MSLRKKDHRKRELRLKPARDGLWGWAWLPKDDRKRAQWAELLRLVRLLHEMIEANDPDKPLEGAGVICEMVAQASRAVELVAPIVYESRGDGFERIFLGVSPYGEQGGGYRIDDGNLPIDDDKTRSVLARIRPVARQEMIRTLRRFELVALTELERYGGAANKPEGKSNTWQFGPGWASYRGHEIKLGGKPRAVLEALATGQRQTATEKMLFDRVWPDEPVEGDTVRSAISDARKALREQLKGKVPLPDDPIPVVERGQGRLAWRLALE